MSKPGLSFGLNLGKKSGPTKPAPPKRKPMFGGEDDSDDDNDNDSSSGANGRASKPSKGTAITELDDDSFGLSSLTTSTTKPGPQKTSKANAKPPSQPPGGDKTKKTQMSMYGDLSSALESRRYQEAAEELDPSVYDYDGVYDSLKPAKKTNEASAADAERRPKYMKSLLASAAVRKRDALIAEEKKIARERELEGDEFADKDKFVTEAYKKQQEENRRLEETERRREEAEAEKNKGGGMTAFYKDLLERNDKRHAETVQAVADKIKDGQQPSGGKDAHQEAAEGANKARTDTDLAREMNQKGAGIAINEDGQVVDQRELLKGGLNLGAVAKKPEPKRDADKSRDSREDRFSSRGQFAPGGKQAMRERQTRMLEAQLEQSLKRSMEEEEAEREKVEHAAKSRKTESDISSAKERYLARKRAAEEAKKQGQA